MRRFVLWCAIPAAAFLACVPIRPSEIHTGVADAGPPAPPQAAPASSQAEFEARVMPILVERCSPCHFEGGRMYDRLPFDRAGTIQVLGTALFTRIRDEEERRVIRDFLGIGAETDPDRESADEGEAHPDGAPPP